MFPVPCLHPLPPCPVDSVQVGTLPMMHVLAVGPPDHQAIGWCSFSSFFSSSLFFWGGGFLGVLLNQLDENN